MVALSAVARTLCALLTAAHSFGAQARQLERVELSAKAELDAMQTRREAAHAAAMRSGSAGPDAQTRSLALRALAQSNDETRAMWPHDFELQLTVKLGGSGSAASATSGVLKTTLAVLNTGDANLIDSRLIHAGGGNDSTKRRVLFYVSFRRRGKVTPSGSLLYKFRRAGYTLDNVEEWNKEAALPEPVA